MSELTDREIHRHVEKNSLGCPNCGGRLMLACKTTLPFSVPEKRIVTRAIQTRNLFLETVEDATEENRRAKDAGVDLEYIEVP